MKHLILASASPRRRELLSEYGFSYTVQPSRYEENSPDLPPDQTVAYLAEQKAREVAQRFPEAIVLGADTVVALEGEILGKPKDRDDAIQTLSRMSGKTHSVFTGVCLIADGKVTVRTVESRVTFLPLSQKTVFDYVDSGLPMDKAGSYGIQDGYPLVEKYEGSYTNIVGFPMECVRELLKEVGLC